MRLSGMTLALALAVAVASLLLAGSAAQATVVDLTTAGASGTINGAVFIQDTTQPAGVGVFQPFLRLQAKGTEQGLNTDSQPFPYDDKNPSNFTHSVLTSDLATVTYQGVAYKQFNLDADQANGPGKDPFSLTDLKIYTASRPDLSSISQLGVPLYDLNAGGSNSVLIDAKLGNGIGKSDMAALIPAGAFGSPVGQYLYLYCQFSNSNGGFEQWSFAQGTNPAVPEPSSAALTVLGLASLGVLRLRRRRAIG